MNKWCSQRVWVGIVVGMLPVAVACGAPPSEADELALEGEPALEGELGVDAELTRPLRTLGGDSVLSGNIPAVDFSGVPVGEFRGTGWIITNAGSVTTGAISVSSSIPEFRVDPAVCAPLAPGASCTVSVTFTPSSEQIFQGLITATGAAPVGGTLLLPASGIGLLGPGSDVPVNFNFSPRSLDFGAVGDGVERSLPLTIRNDGGPSGPLGLAIIPTSGASVFRVVPNTCGSIFGGGRCEVIVSFVPSGNPAVHLENLVVTGGGETLGSVPLVGENTAAGVIIEPDFFP